MKNRLDIFFRHKQLFLDKDPLQPVIVQGNVDGTTSYVPGTVPVTAWQKMTEYAEGIDKLKLSWSATEASENDVNEGTGSNFQKGIAADIRFDGLAYQFIYDWLMKEFFQCLNAVEVKIVDNECEKNFRIFEIKCDNIDYAPEEEPCLVTVPIREMDEAIHVFQRTIIEDNWQGWFNKDGTSTKDHPTFPFIVERKPKFYMAVYAALLYVVGMLSVGILIALNDGKKWIRRTLGFSYFCPSPLIRTYIQNICDKYGFTYNTMFDDIPTNEYRDVCLFWPASTSLKNFEDFQAPSTKFVWDNRTVYPFSKFLNQLKKVFNAEWYITPNNELVFQPKAYFNNLSPLYDFTAPGADKIYKLRYSFNGKKKAAYGKYEYLVDPQDTCSNELKYRYNATVDFDGPAYNPMLEGNVTKTFDFAMTSFHNDGSSKDFLEEGIELGRLIAIGALIVGLGQLFLASNFLTVAVVTALLTAGYIITNGHVNNYFNNANLNGIVRVSSSEINIPRLLLWDRSTAMDEAKVVSVQDPTANPKYNTVPVDYYTEHPTYDNEAGVFQSSGGSVDAIYNYPMYVEELFFDNLYDRFHEYDNPLLNPIINQDWEGELDLCCEWMDRLGAWENDFVKIGYTLVLEDRDGRKIKGKISKIGDIDYDKGRIQISGEVLK